MKHPNCRLQHVPHNGKYLLISWWECYHWYHSYHNWHW
jgi:hypothetical protein